MEPLSTAANGADPRYAHHGVAIFDGDDTLWETMSLYDSAKAKFYAMMESLAFVHDDAAVLLDEIDTRRVKAMGFKTGRFPGSMLETYRQLCARAGMSPDSSVESRCIEIGEQVFSEPVQPYPDSASVLRQIHDRFQVVLLTKGDVDVQNRRVNESGLRDLFDVIVVVPDKDEDTLRRLLDENDWPVRSSWMIGNSRRSDIDPALSVGMRAVWIPRDTWSYEHERHGRRTGFVVRQELSEVPSVLMQS